MARLSVAVSAGFKAAFLQLSALFERREGHQIQAAWVPSVELAAHLAREEPIDAVIGAKSAVTELARSGLLTAGSVVDLASSGIGVAARTKDVAPDITSTDSLRSGLLAARSIGYSAGPSGTYLLSLFEKMRIGEQLRPKLKKCHAAVGEMLLRGEADIGFQQVSELLPIKSIEYLGPLPADIQHLTTFSGAISSRACEIAAAAAFLQSCRSAYAKPIIEQAGMQPA